MTTLNEEVKSELVAMKSVGMKVPKKLLDSVDKMDLSEYWKLRNYIMYYGSVDEKTAFEKVKSGEWSFEDFEGYMEYVTSNAYSNGQFNDGY